MIRFDRDQLAPPVPAAFTHARRVRFQDVDAAGIVFYPRVLEYFHDAYVAWMDAENLGFAEAVLSREWGAPIKHVEATFVRPMKFGDDVSVELVGCRLDGSDIWLAYRILSRGGALVAFGHTHQVSIDLATFKRSALPPDKHAVFARLPSLVP